ncbi:nucleotidyltransferase domain-containing protein [Caulobacter sp. Root343]|uniref:nucleotidyltransferase domain-containing protein n=1 Tax=Caulobacter sp. Root343 TaxID=1736520 RepID=UPI0006F7E040|nr:nucleotidyltransferase domain-containing protein [Caulobacter sp. Root343]KQV64091.1 hypothetical protein ASC70_19915 [Caulobacter sp. Root343]
MIGPVLLLYGSKARGDARPGSDIDLLLALEGEDLQPPTTTHGVSLHRYPKGWLEKSARAGTLFSYHVAFEGIALDDPDGFIAHLRGLFQLKASYHDERALGARVMRLLLENDWGPNLAARQRFFWALRTVLIAASTRIGSPIFAAPALERLAGVEGVAALIDDREKAGFETCQRLGLQVLSTLSPENLAEPGGQMLRDRLMAEGGIARDSVRILEEGEAIADIGLAIYL